MSAASPRWATSPGRRVGNGSALAPPPLVGRERELALLHAGLEAAAAGHGQLFLLEGEPGIGKTRLAVEVASAAEGQGLLPLWGRCADVREAPAYWPWVQVLRACIRAVEPPDPGTELGARAAEVARLVPEAGPAPPGAPPPEPGVARLLLMDAVTAYLCDASQHRPLLVILEDLHRADPSSLRLLEFLAGELRGARLLVVATARSTEPGRTARLERTLAQLTGAGSAHRLPLAPLDAGAVGQLVAWATGCDPDPEVVAGLHARTGGLPLFVTEVLRETDPGALDAGLPGPATLREVIAQRLAGLSPRTRQVLRAAAVLGVEVDAAVLARVAEVSGEEVLGALDEAAAARILAPADPGRWRFIHALVRDWLYDDLASGERGRLHRQAADVLEEVHAADPEPHLAELTAHLAAAAQTGEGLERVVEYAERAGRVALEHHAYEEAAARFEQALEADRRAGSTDLVRRAGLLLALGDARHAAGEVGGARTACREAARVARRCGSPELLARAALGAAGPWPAREPEHVTLLEEAAATLGDGPLRATLLGRLAWEVAATPPGDHAAAVRLADEALRTAERNGDPEALARVLLDAAINVRGWVGHAPERLTLADRAIAIAREHGLAVLAPALFERAIALLELGRLAEFERTLVEHAAAGQRLRLTIPAVRATVTAAMRAFLAGRCADVERHARELRALGDRMPGAAVAGATQLFLLRREQGRAQEGADALACAAGTSATADPSRGAGADRLPTAGTPLTSAFRLMAEAESGRAVEARATFEDLTRHGLAAIPRDRDWALVMAVLAEACPDLGDTATAAALYDLLRPHVDRMVVFGYIVTCLGPVSRFLGTLALALDRPDAAAAHFADAVTASERIDARLWAAWSRLGLAQALLAGGRAADAQRSQRLVSEVAAVADELGLSRLAAAAREVRAAATPAVTGVAGPGGRLTPRELEVLALLAQGLSNRRIAEELVITQKTVKTHVSSILAKLHVSDRTQAALHAVRTGLTPPAGRSGDGDPPA